MLNVLTEKKKKESGTEAATPPPKTAQWESQLGQGSFYLENLAQGSRERFPSLTFFLFFLKLFYYFYCYLFIFIFWPCHTARHVGSLFPDQGSNPRPLCWKRGVSTTGPPGKSPASHSEQIHNNVLFLL